MSTGGPTSPDDTRAFFDRLKVLKFEELTQSMLAPVQALAEQKSKKVQPDVVYREIIGATTGYESNPDLDPQIKEGLKSLIAVALSCFLSSDVKPLLTPLTLTIKNLEKEDNQASQKITHALLQIQKNLELFFSPPEAIPEPPPPPIPQTVSASPQRARVVKPPPQHQNNVQAELFAKLEQLSVALNKKEDKEKKATADGPIKTFASLTFKRDLKAKITDRDMRQRKQLAEIAKKEAAQAVQENYLRTRRTLKPTASLTSSPVPSPKHYFDSEEEVIRQFGEIDISIDESSPRTNRKTC